MKKTKQIVNQPIYTAVQRFSSDTFYYASNVRIVCKMYFFIGFSFSRLKYRLINT